MIRTIDALVIGAGSIGLPTALALTRKGLKTLVIEQCSSPGQVNNKKAIGGIRATHSDYGKIQLGLRSIEIFSKWNEEFGEDIGWLRNGYSFPVYADQDRNKLLDLLKIQISYGLNIKWIDAADYADLVPGIKMDGLLGATYSPDDGSASPLLAANAFYFKSLDHDCRYGFGETVIDCRIEGDRVDKVITNKGSYSPGFVINAAGNNARRVGLMFGLELPVRPDNHEGAISEPVKRFMGPMVVDMRPAESSLNYYFYQNKEGQVVFCITPHPPIWGVENDSTSQFLPKVASRMVDLYPRLANLKVRRTWRGQYPNTPDGFPIIGMPDGLSNVVNAVGMCGQGFMLGPGVGELVSRLVTREFNQDDNRILKSFELDRDFSTTEVFK